MSYYYLSVAQMLYEEWKEPSDASWWNLSPEVQRRWTRLALYHSTELEKTGKEW